MTSNISSMLNSRMRMSGLSSGLDTDSIVKQLLTADQLKIDKAKQDKQILEWKSSSYRDITNSLRAFQDEYFDFLKPSTNLRSETAFAVFNSTSSDETIATATASIGAVAKSHPLVVKSLASNAKLEGSTAITKKVMGSNDIVDFSLQGKQINVTLDGVSKTIDLEDYADIGDLETKLEASLSSAFGTGKFDIAVTGNKIEFKTLLSGSKFSISNASDLGFSATDNTSNRISLSTSLDSIEGNFANSVDFDAAGNVQFSINGVNIDIGKTFANTTINDVISAVNTSSAGVEMSYDSLKDSFLLTTKSTGANQTVTYTDTSGLFGALGISTGTLTNGTDAKFDLDGVTNMIRSSNEFTIDGVSFNLKKADAGTTVNIAVTTDASGLVDKIKGFINKYNELIEKINGKTSEKRDRSYLPLTDEQKEAMNDSQIDKWEESAKAGLLYNDGILNNITNSMRSALNDVVEGTGISLAKIGITTGSYQTKGKLILDENKLKTAINNDPNAIAQLFTKTSQYSYNDALDDSAKRDVRYKESGLAQRLYDIMQDNIRTIRDSSGRKGLLLEKAGIDGDITEFKNIITNEINDKDSLIDTLYTKLYSKEDSLYAKFTAMEKALSQMNSQSSWLTQQFSSQG